MRLAPFESVEKAFFSKILNYLQHGSLIIEFWDGDVKAFGAGDPVVNLSIKKPAVLRELLFHPSLGFGEAYMNGDVEVSDLRAFLKIVNLNNETISKLVSNKVQINFHKNHKKNQEKFIRHHYDLGNNFFKLWLDTSMTYSCAYFQKLDDSLETAQDQKREYILKKLNLQEGMTLLDIGSGWGQLLIHAAKKYNIKGLGITLSQEQYEHAKERAKQEEVAHLITFEIINYQDLVKRSFAFDRIVSVGMFEHVGKDNFDTYFSAVHKLLKDGGVTVLHTISSQNSGGTDPWMDKYIFPGGYLPSPEQVMHYSSAYNLRFLDYENLRLHYAKTLDEWSNRFYKHKDQVLQMYDDVFYRMWDLYLNGSSASFRYGNLDLSQFIFSKGINNELPLTREYLYL